MGEPMTEERRKEIEARANAAGLVPLIAALEAIRDEARTALASPLPKPEGT